MKKLALLLLTLLAGTTMAHEHNLAIVIHGGAGTILKENLSDEKEAEIRAKLTEAINVGYKVLENGGESTAAVMAAINVMENSPLFNSGKGAVYNKVGKHELDASIMRGSDLQAGAVAGVKLVKNPINATFEVLQNSPHVMLSGDGADEFAKQQKLDIVDNHYFDTKYRYQQWQVINQSSRVRCHHLIPLTEPYVRTSYTAHVNFTL
jgi:beta-aspartyl-peptidase (threonine type)